MRTLYIHIGQPKTGTTAIQHCLYDYGATIGAVYPKSICQYRAQHVFSRLCGAEINWVLFDRDRDYLREFKDSVLKSRMATTVISSESLWQLTQAQVFRLKALLSFFDCIKIVVYLRNQVDYAESDYLQVIKTSMGYRKKYHRRIRDYVSHFCSSEENNYLLHLSYWENVFGEKNIIVRQYEKAWLAEGDVVADFLNILSAKKPLLQGKPNRSIDLTGMKIMHFLTHLNPNSFLTRKVGLFITRMALSPEKFKLDRKSAVQIFNHFHESNMELSKKYSLKMLSEEDMSLGTRPAVCDFVLSPEECFAVLTGFARSLVNSSDCFKHR